MVFFETRLIGDLLQRVGDHSRVQNFLTNSVTSACFSILSLFVFGIILLIYNLQIFVIFIIGTFVYCFWICIFFSKRRIIDNELFSQDSINQSKIYEMLSSIQEIKLQRCENRKRLEWEDARASLFDIKSKSLKFQQIQEAGSIFINELEPVS